MTGGIVVILGPVGENFGAGMTGGQVFVFDDFDTLESQANLDTIEILNITDEQCESCQTELQKLIQQHIDKTGSRWAAKLSRNWDSYLDAFKVVRPKQTTTLEIAEPIKLSQREQQGERA
jgi:glutamate synthase (NADPH/NADH) large chain